MVIRFAEWLSATQNGYPLRGMKVNFRPFGRKFSFLIKKRGGLIKLFKVCGFSRQSLEPPSAEGGILSVLQTDCAPQAVWKE
jgi:hypothetical protein